MSLFGSGALLAAAVVVSLEPFSVGSKLWIEHRGQDTLVRREPDGEVVYTTSVDDTSAGSDTDSDMAGDEEFFYGCMWTMRQKLEICSGGNCAEAEIMAHDLQRRLLAFYQARGGSGSEASAAPPLEEVAWLVAGTTREQRAELTQSCPGLVVTVLFLAAEVLAFGAGMAQAEVYAREAESYSAILQRHDPAQFQTMVDMFPMWEAYAAWNAGAKTLEDVRASKQPPSVDVVVARCRTSLQWLWEFQYPPRTRVLVYEKCGAGEDDFEAQTLGLRGAVESIEQRTVSAREDPGGLVTGGLMTGECTAYLAHLMRSLRAGDLADYTVFLHDDGPRHIRISLLSLALRGLISGAYEVPFLHLSHERYPAFKTPCLSEVYRLVFGEELRGRLSSYCCAHFIVSRQRIEARGLPFYERLLALVSEAPYSLARGGLCKVGFKPCYVLEFIWHRIFGESDELPLRAEQSSLPPALRYEGGRSSRLESPLKVSPYMIMFQPGSYSSRLLRGEQSQRSMSEQ